jgi:hypothetical protein
VNGKFPGFHVLLFVSVTCTIAAPVAAFRAVEIDSKIEIGYGVAVADVDGDNKPDIVLVDKKQVAWYRNPTWEKFVIAENLTKLDNVCIAARDIDGDGKAEIAIGAGWNPSDTVDSGAVFYLVAPSDRTQKWRPVELPHEPTVHRMRWVRNSTGRFDLVVVPLHGRANQNGQGAGVKILSYTMPSNVESAWKTEVINDSWHLSHNFEVVKWSRQPGDELLVACREGVFHLVPTKSGSNSREKRDANPSTNGWQTFQLAGNRAGQSEFAGAGEVRSGKVHGKDQFLATVEPMHGNQLVIYTAPNVDATSPLWNRKVLDSTLKEGHALACGDFAGMGIDQVVVGWRSKNEEGKVGVKILSAIDENLKEWKQAIVDDNTMACEDLCVTDVNGDGKLDIVASGRATKNLKIYFNTTSQK